MAQSSDLPSRIDRLENGEIEMKMAVSALLSTVEIHQRNMEVFRRDMEVFRRDMEVFRANADRTNHNIEAMLQIMNQSLQRMEVIESDIRGIQTENRRILDILQQRNSGDA